MANEKILYERDSVFIHTIYEAGNEDVLIGGVLYITEKGGEVIVEWKPIDEMKYDVSKKSTDQDWAVIDAVGYKNYTRTTSNNSDTAVSLNPGLKPSHNVKFNIKDLQSFKRPVPKGGWCYMIFILKNGTKYPALHFHEGGSKTFMKKLKEYIHIRKSTHDSSLFLIKEDDPGALSKSFDELHLFKESSSDLTKKFFKTPYDSTLSGFSKVTNFLKDVLLVENAQPKQRPKEELADILSEDLPGVEVSQQEPGFEVVTRTQLPERKEVKRDKPLDMDQWKAHLNNDGMIVNIDKLKAEIFRGGVEPSIRMEVWKFLLGYYKWDSTFKSRQEERKTKVDDYFRMKLQWKSISAEQEKRFGVMKERKNLIDKDVLRTDRTNPFYAGENNPNLVVLYDMLMTYCMYNFDLGYVQGMSDLLAPIHVVMENEVDAFWCFAGFLELVHLNFEMDQEGMKKQLAQLHTLLKLLDFELLNYLENHESGNMYFCFRWLLIWFKREFSFPDIMRLWEVMWTGLPCCNYHLIICCAIIDLERGVLMDSDFGFTDILRHINDLSYKISQQDTLNKAEAIYKQLSECKNLPQTVREIICKESDQSGKGSTHSSTLKINGTELADCHNGDANSENSFTGMAISSPDDSSIELIPDDGNELPVYAGY